jgi:hypothetical protein
MFIKDKDHTCPISPEGYEGDVSILYKSSSRAPNEEIIQNMKQGTPGALRRMRKHLTEARNRSQKGIA